MTEELNEVKIDYFDPNLWNVWERSRERPVDAILLELFPDLSQTVICTVPDDEWQVPRLLVDQIIHLNDHHRWSREEIADWLESLDIDLTFSKE